MGHVVHEMAPFKLEKVPAGQNNPSLVDLSLFKNLPTEHWIQEDIPDVFANLPDGQSSHLEDSSEFENVPGGHDEQNIMPRSEANLSGGQERQPWEFVVLWSTARMLFLIAYNRKSSFEDHMNYSIHLEIEN